jgi:hypothetical protein
MRRKSEIPHSADCVRNDDVFLLRRKASYLVWRGVEEVVGGVGGANFLAGVRGIATGGGGFAAFGVDALDAGGARENAVPFVADYVDQQPWDGVGIGRRGIGDGFAGDAAVIVRFPSGAGEMLAEWFAILIEELGVWGFQDPVELCDTFLASIDLITLGVDG